MHIQIFLQSRESKNKTECQNNSQNEAMQKIGMQTQQIQNTNKNVQTLILKDTAIV